MMKNDDNLNRQPHWRCRLCGHSTPLGEAVCSNPNCRADLGIYGEAVTPGREEPDHRAQKQWEEEARRRMEEAQERDAEERRRQDEARWQKEEAQRQTEEEQQRKAEEKARKRARQQDSRIGDSGDGGAVSVLVKFAAGLAAACALLSLVDIVLIGRQGRYFWFLRVPALADAAYCAAVCLCCVWCLKTRGARPWPWLSIALAVVGIPLTLWVLDRNYLNGHYGIMLFSHRHYRSVSLPEFLSQAAEKGYLRHVLTKLACVVMAVLGPGVILLYQLRQRKRPK